MSGGFFTLYLMIQMIQMINMVGAMPIKACAKSNRVIFNSTSHDTNDTNDTNDQNDQNEWTELILGQVG